MSTVRQDKVQVLVEINGAEAGKTLKELNNLERDLVRQIRNDLIPGTKEWIAQTEKLREVKGRIKDLTDEFKPLEVSQEKQIRAFAKLGEGIAAAFALSKVLPFGKAQADVAKAAEQAQQAIAIALSARAIAEGIVEARLVVRLVMEKAAALQSKLLATATAAYGTVLSVLAGQMTLAQLGQLALNAAMRAFPAVAIISSIGAIVAAFVEWVSWTNKQKEALEDLKVSATDAYKQIKDNVNDTYDQIVKRDEQALELAKARGESAQQIYKLELKLIDDKLKALEVLEKTAGSLDKKELDERQALLHKREVMEAQFRTAQLNAQKKSADDRLKEEKAFDEAYRKMMAARIEAERTIRQMEVDLIDDEHIKTIEKLKLEAQQKIDALMGDPRALIERGDLIAKQIKLINEQLNADLQAENLEFFAKTAQQEIDEAERVAQEKRRLQQQVRDAEWALAKQTTETINALYQNQAQKQLNISQARLDAEEQQLERQLANNQITQEQYDKKKRELEENAARAEREIKRKAFRAQKEAAFIGATINTAEAVTKALTGAIPPFNLALAAIAGASGALEIATILSQPTPQFKVGGYTGGVNKNKAAGIVHENEWVANKELVDHPVYGSIIGYLEGVRRRGFADGGFTSTPTTSIVNTVNNVSATGDVFGMITAELRGLREDVRNQRTLLRAFIPYTDLTDALDTGSEISGKAKIN